MKPIVRAPRLTSLFLFITLLTCAVPSAAQQRVVADLPDAPAPKQQLSEPERKSKRGFSQTTVQVLSRRSFFFPDLAYTSKPLSSGQKFLLAADVTIAPSAILATAASAAVKAAPVAGSAV